MVKKMILIAFIVCLIVTINTRCFTQDSRITDNLDFISNINTVNKAFNISTIDQASDYKVNYNYNIIDIDKSTDIYVTINGSITNNNNEYSFDASGEIPVVDLSNDSKFIEGPIDGNMNINNVLHDITIGFRSIKNTDKVSIGLTIYPNENNPDFQDILFIRFGNFSKSKNLIDDLNNSSDTNESNIASYKYEGCDTADFIPSNLCNQTGTGQKIETYVSYSDKNIIVDLHTYTNKFDDLDFTSVPDGEFINAGIHEFRIGLRKTLGDGFITGIKNLDLAPYSNREYKLEDVFFDMLGNFEIQGYWTLSSIFNNTKGEISSSNAVNNTYINVVVEEGKIIDFDDDGMKVIFLTSNQNTDRTTYEAYSKVTYVIDCFGAAFFVGTEDTSATICMDYE